MIGEQNKANIENINKFIMLAPLLPKRGGGVVGCPLPTPGFARGYQYTAPDGAGSHCLIARHKVPKQSPIPPTMPIVIAIPTCREKQPPPSVFRPLSSVFCLPFSVLCLPSCPVTIFFRQTYYLLPSRPIKV